MGQTDVLVVAGDVERLDAERAALDVVELPFDDMAAVVVGDGIGQGEFGGGDVGYLPLNQLLAVRAPSSTVDLR